MTDIQSFDKKFTHEISNSESQMDHRTSLKACQIPERAQRAGEAKVDPWAKCQGPGTRGSLSEEVIYIPEFYPESF